MSITAMKTALSTLELAYDVGYTIECEDSIVALRTAIAEAEKVEPVAWQRIDPETNERIWDEDSFSSHPNDLDYCIPLFLAAGAQPAPKQEPHSLLMPPSSAKVNGEKEIADLSRLPMMYQRYAYRMAKKLADHLAVTPAQERKGLFIDMIAEHEGLAEEIAWKRKPLSVAEVEQILARWDYDIHGDRARFIVRETEIAHGIKETA